MVRLEADGSKPGDFSLHPGYDRLPEEEQRAPGITFLYRGRYRLVFAGRKRSRLGPRGSQPGVPDPRQPCAFPHVSRGRYRVPLRRAFSARGHEMALCNRYVEAWTRGHLCGGPRKAHRGSGELYSSGTLPGRPPGAIGGGPWFPLTIPFF